MEKARLGKTIAAVLMALSFQGVTIDSACAQDASSSSVAPIRQTLPPHVLNARPEKIRKNYWLAYQLAAYEWLDKVAEADPSIIAAICSRPGPSQVLAKHPHLDKIAQADHYLCRRLCRWRRAANNLVRNYHADQVIALDPQGFIMAMDRDPVYARIIAGHRQFNELIYNDPELGKQIALHIR
jgi:hypothetical protein